MVHSLWIRQYSVIVFRGIGYRNCRTECSEIGKLIQVIKSDTKCLGTAHGKTRQSAMLAVCNRAEMGINERNELRGNDTVEQQISFIHEVAEPRPGRARIRSGPRLWRRRYIMHSRQSVFVDNDH